MKSLKSLIRRFWARLWTDEAALDIASAYSRGFLDGVRHGDPFSDRAAEFSAFLERVGDRGLDL